MSSCANGHAVSPDTQYSGEDVRPRCYQGHPSPAGSLFCETCGALLGAEPAHPVPSDLATEYTTGPFSAILSDEGQTGDDDAPIRPDEADTPGTGGAGPGLTGAVVAGAAAVGAATGPAAADVGRGRRRWSLALGLAVLIAAGVTSELALSQHRAEHQAQASATPSLGAAPTAAPTAIPTGPPSVAPTAPASAAPSHRASAATVSLRPNQAGVPAPTAAPTPLGQRAALSARQPRYWGLLLPGRHPVLSGWRILPIWPVGGPGHAVRPGVLPGAGIPLRGFPPPPPGLPRHW